MSDYFIVCQAVFMCLGTSKLSEASEGYTVDPCNWITFEECGMGIPQESNTQDELIMPSKNGALGKNSYLGTNANLE